MPNDTEARLLRLAPVPCGLAAVLLFSGHLTGTAAAAGFDASPEVLELHAAAGSGSAEQVAALIAAHPDQVGTAGKYEQTPLHLAAAENPDPERSSVCCWTQGLD